MTIAKIVFGGCLLGFAGTALAQGTPAANPAQTSSATVILNREQAEKIMPATVFFLGQTATTQGRNSAGIRLAGGKLVLAAIVDTGGYSSGVQEKYQAYLITELSLRVGGKLLVPGAYGLGFVANDRATVMDVGGNEVLSAATTRDLGMKRPTPLQIVSDGSAYRLYLGRSFVTLAPDTGK